jgi:outer membrane protein
MRKLLKLFVLCAAFFMLMPTLWAQQMTRTAVVDLTKVYTAFFRDSKAVRDFEEASASVQTEINRLTAEIQELQRSQVAAASSGYSDRALQIGGEVNRKTEYLKTYYQVKTAELEQQKKALTQSSAFLGQVSAAIQRVAEAEGFTLVLNQKESTGILWFSPNIDITSKVIDRLQSAAR